MNDRAIEHDARPRLQTHWPLLRLAATSLVVLSGLGIPAQSARAAGGDVSCAPDSGSASISGTVTTSTAAPANNVQVSAYTVYGFRGGYDYTDASGAYQITGLIGGPYILEFKPPAGSDMAEWSGNQPGPTTATTVTVLTAGSTTGIDAQLNPGARIRGQISGTGGAGLSSVRVDVFNASGQAVASAYSDATGVYTTSPGLPSGPYRLLYSQAYGYASEYYNNAPDLNTATAVTLTAPTLVNGIDAQLDSGGTITGVVTSAATGLPLQSIQVSASGTAGYAYDYTDSNGQYTVVGLGSGSYSVSASPISSENLIAPRQTATVTAPTATTNVNFSMSAGGTLSGQVTDLGGTPLENITVYVGGRDVDFGDYFSTNAAGVYTATGMPTGTYFVLFRPSDTYIPEAYNDRGFEADLYDDVPVTAPATVSGIDAELAPGSRISGTVTDGATGDPIEGVFVEILDLRGGRIETDFTDAAGHYETPATLSAGTYKVIFNADDRNVSCAFVSEFYGDARTLESAATVTVGADTTVAGVDGALERGSIIFGHVTAEDTGAPITYGGVQFRSPSGKLESGGSLTFLGGYHSEALPSGTYTARFHDNGQSGYIDEYFNNVLSAASAQPITVTAPDDLYDIDAALARGGLVSGHVTVASTGLPFTAGYIEVIDASGEVVGYGDLNSDGAYTVMEGLASGNYRVAVVPYEGEGGDVPSPFIPSFYRGTPLPAASLWVPVAAPATVAGIDIAILNGVFLPNLGR